MVKSTCGVMVKKVAPGETHPLNLIYHFPESFLFSWYSSLVISPEANRFRKISSDESFLNCWPGMLERNKEYPEYKDSPNIPPDHVHSP